MCPTAENMQMVTNSRGKRKKKKREAMTTGSAQEQRLHRDIAKFFGHFRNFIYSVKAFEGRLPRQQCLPRGEPMRRTSTEMLSEMTI